LMNDKTPLMSLKSPCSPRLLLHFDDCHYYCYLASVGMNVPKASANLVSLQKRCVRAVLEIQEKQEKFHLLPGVLDDFLCSHRGLSVDLHYSPSPLLHRC